MKDEYKESYLTLFNAVTDALKAMEAANYGEAKTVLMAAQQAAEEAFIGREEQA